MLHIRKADAKRTLPPLLICIRTYITTFEIQNLAPWLRIIYTLGEMERGIIEVFFDLNKLSRVERSSSSSSSSFFFLFLGTKRESQKAVGRAKMALRSLYPRPRLFEFGLRALFVKGIHKIRPRARVSCILNRFARTKPLLRPLRMKITTKREFASPDKRISRTCNVEKFVFLQYIIVGNGNIMEISQLERLNEI